MTVKLCLDTGVEGEDTLCTLGLVMPVLLSRDTARAYAENTQMCWEHLLCHASEWERGNKPKKLTAMEGSGEESMLLSNALIHYTG